MKNVIKYMIIILLVLIIGIFIIFFYKEKEKVDLEDVVQPAMNMDGLKTPNWYFFNNDKLYVYDVKDGLYSVSFSLDDKKIISKSNELRLPHIYMVYNNEAYYYSEYNRGLKKINLETGNIETIKKDKYLYLMSDTLKDGKVLVNYTNDYVNKSYVYIGLLELNTLELSNEKKVNYVGNYTYFYDTTNNNIYYIEKENNMYNIYQNNKIIYSYKYGNSSDLVFIQDNYLFLLTTDKILKFDLNNYSIIEEKKINISISLISSVKDGGIRTLGNEEKSASIALYPFFQTDEKIYKFNSDKLLFEEIVANKTYGYIQKYDNYYVFQSETKTIIYNDIIGKSKIYNSNNYTMENNYIYLMTYKGDFYHQKNNNLRFKIKKLLLDKER